jgi:hypothetical protein
MLTRLDALSNNFPILTCWEGLILYTVGECAHPNNEEKFPSLEKSRKTTLEVAQEKDAPSKT